MLRSRAVPGSGDIFAHSVKGPTFVVSGIATASSMQRLSLRAAVDVSEPVARPCFFSTMRRENLFYRPLLVAVVLERKHCLVVNSMLLTRSTRFDDLVRDDISRIETPLYPVRGTYMQPEVTSRRNVLPRCWKF